jgi:hypothetical protein
MAALAGGSMPFLAVLILFLVGVIIALYTRKGSGMDHHAYRHVYGGAPGAALPCDDFSGGDRTSWTERDVLMRWRAMRRAGGAVARVSATQAEETAEPAAPSNRLPIHDPMGARRPC